MRAANIAVTAALALGVSGCWAAALQLAPVGLQVAEDIGAGAVHLVEGAAVASHQGKTDPNRQLGDEVDREDRCDELEIEVPGVIELRKNATGTAQYRELRLGGGPDESIWAPALDHDTAAGGWRPAVNFVQMNFTPPLAGALPNSGTIFLAYAPTEPTTSVERDLLVAMTVNFGTAIGSFNWKGRSYQYSLARKLPCFPPPA
jgi:hypothetical protein